jgi:hypothetical protein
MINRDGMPAAASNLRREPMKGSSLAAFVIASIFLCFMGVHYTYYFVFGSPESVLHDYLEEQIKGAENLDELVAEYETSLQLIAAYEIERPDMEVLTRYQQQSVEPYKTKIRLETAIDVWEKKTREYQRVWYSWAAGLILFVVGATGFVLYRSWMPLSIHIAGLGQMIWSASPTQMIVGALAEHERLLGAKLLMTVLTFALLMAAWYLSERMQKRPD